MGNRSQFLNNRGNVGLALVAGAMMVSVFLLAMKAFPQIKWARDSYQKKASDTEALNAKLEALMSLSSNTPLLSSTDGEFSWTVQTVGGVGSRLKQITVRLNNRPMDRSVAVVGYRYDEY